MNEINFLKTIVISFCLIEITNILFRKFRDDEKIEKERKLTSKHNFINNCNYQKYQSSVDLNNEKRILDAKNKAEINNYKFNLEKII